MVRRRRSRNERGTGVGGQLRRRTGAEAVEGGGGE